MTVTCTAWIQKTPKSLHDDAHRRTCVLKAGHYQERGDGASWHTDCTSAAGRDRPGDNNWEHNHTTLESRSCLVWSDYADGAHRADVIKEVGDIQSKIMDDSDLVSVKLLPPARPITEDDVLPLVDAHLVVGRCQVKVTGSAMFVNRVVTAAAEALQEEAER